MYPIRLGSQQFRCYKRESIRAGRELLVRRIERRRTQLRWASAARNVHKSTVGESQSRCNPWRLSRRHCERRRGSVFFEANTEEAKEIGTTQKTDIDFAERRVQNETWPPGLTTIRALKLSEDAGLNRDSRRPRFEGHASRDASGCSSIHGQLTSCINPQLGRNFERKKGSVRARINTSSDSHLFRRTFASPSVDGQRNGEERVPTGWIGDDEVRFSNSRCLPQAPGITRPSRARPN